MYIMRFVTFITLVLAVLQAVVLAGEIDSLQLSENLVQLDGSASSDADGDNLQYRWRQVAGPRVKLLNADTAKPNFYAVVAGRYTFELVVSDGKASSKPALVNIEVEKINHIPVAVLPRNFSGKINEAILLDASSSADADGDALTYHWLQVSGPKVIFRRKNTDTPFLNVAFAQEGEYVFELTTHDGTAGSKPVRCAVTVIKPNSAPVARVINVNQKVRIRKNAIVVNDYSKKKPVSRTVRVMSGELSKDTLSENGNIQNYTPTCSASSKTCSVKAEVKSGVGSSVMQPIASTSGNRTVEPGSRVIIKGFGVDPQNNRLQYYWRQTAGPKVSLESSRGENINFVPKKEGIYIFELVVNNGSVVSKPAACAITVAKDVSGLMSLGGDKISDTAVNDVEIPGIEPIQTPARRGGLLSKFFSGGKK